MAIEDEIPKELRKGTLFAEIGTKFRSQSQLYEALRRFWKETDKKASAAHRQRIAEEISRRRGTKPTPGTIYPALKDLSKRGLIEGEKRGKKSFTA